MISNRTIPGSSVLSPINQATFQQLLESAPPNAKFADLLQENGYSTQISDLALHLNSTKKIDFSGCQFDNVRFSGNFQQYVFDNVQFKNSIFHQAQLTSSVFLHTKFSNCTFVNSNVANVSFINSEINNTKSWDCDFTNTAFAHTNIRHSLFAKAKLDNVLDHANHIENMHIVFTQNYSSDYAFNKANLHQIKPNVAVVGDSEWHDVPYQMVDKYSGVPTTIDQDSPQNIDLHKLSSEVANVINDIKLHGLKAPSIAQQVIHSDEPTIKAIWNFAYQIVEKVDGVWIPGGPDLHPEFYGETNTNSYPSWSYYREILEFSMTDAAIALNKPLIGICHGSQLVNVYFGGTLHQHVDGQNGITPLLDILTNDGLIGSEVAGAAHGPSFHHQAVKEVASPLQVVATYDGVVKATQAVDGKKVMLLQFHPEYEYDQTSKNILSKFIKLSADTKMLQKVVELNDVIDFGNPLDKLLGTLDKTLAIDNHQAAIKAVAEVAHTIPSQLSETVHSPTLSAMIPELTHEHHPVIA